MTQKKAIVTPQESDSSFPKISWRHTGNSGLPEFQQTSIWFVSSMSMESSAVRPAHIRASTQPSDAVSRIAHGPSRAQHRSTHVMANCDFVITHCHSSNPRYLGEVFTSSGQIDLIPKGSDLPFTVPVSSGWLLMKERCVATSCLAKQASKNVIQAIRAFCRGQHVVTYFRRDHPHILRRSDNTATAYEDRGHLIFRNRFVNPRAMELIVGAIYLHHALQAQGQVVSERLLCLSAGKRLSQLVMHAIERGRQAASVPSTIHGRFEKRLAIQCTRAMP